MNSDSFTDPDTWIGGFYELSIQLGERDDVRLRAAMDAITAHPQITGWYRRKDIAATEQVRIVPTHTELQPSRHFYGLVSLPGYPPLACGCLVVRYDPGAIDWFTVYIPMGAL